VNSSDSTSDERSIAGELLAQLLKDQGRGPGQVIRAQTYSRAQDCREQGTDVPLIILAQAKRSVVEQFRHVALRRCRLEEVFGNLDWLELDIQEWDAIQDCFANRDARWETFRKCFPRSQGLVAVSCPAFNADFSQAMIEYTLIGALGMCCLYQREASHWKFVAQKCTWIS
jgi:hypothetical protein